MTLLLVSFIAGVLTVLAPCILPLLPVIIGGSVSDVHSRLKPYIITASLAISIIVFTLLLKASTLLIEIPGYVWGYVSGVVLILIGLFLTFPQIWERLSFLSSANASSQRMMSSGFQKQSYMGDIVVGAALGPVFSTCSPTYFLILATILPASFALGMVYLIAYTLGLSVMLLLISLIRPKVYCKDLLGC